MCDGKTSYVALSRGMREAVQHCIIIYSIKILHVQINVLLTNFNPARLNTILKVQITKQYCILTLLDNSKLLVMGQY